MTDVQVRLTQPALKVLRFLLEKPREGRSGVEISKAAKVSIGTVYPLLARLEDAGWLSSEWEPVEPREIGRPRRRFYNLTGAGYRKAQEALAELQIVNGGLQWTALR